MESLQGQLLLASVRMDDPGFARTLILMLEHQPQGSMGLILNRSTHRNVHELWSQVSDQPCFHDGELFQGGPCEGPLMALHTVEALSDAQPLAGVFLTHESDKIEQLVGESPQPLRLINGYSGWAAGQLEAELDQGVWQLCRGSQTLIFHDPASAWLTALAQVDPIEAMLIHKPFLRPPEPWMN